MQIFFLFAGFLLALLLGFFITPQILSLSHKKKLYDFPDERKTHEHPVPSLGGVAFVPTLLIVFGLTIGGQLLFDTLPSLHDTTTYLVRLVFFMVGLMMLYFVGLADDLAGIGYKKKFLAQLAVSSLLVASGFWINHLHGLFGYYCAPAWFGIPLTIFTIIYITNAINLIDGVDGLASGLCALALVAFTWLNIHEQQYDNALISVITLGVIIPFWLSNVFGSAESGRKLFMGDTGSLTLGLVLSYLAISACRVTPEVAHDTTDAVVAFSILFIPLIDVVRVVAHRLRHGRNPFLPDRNHFHHKLLRMGLPSWGVMVAILAYCLFFLGLNLLLAPLMNLTWVLLIDLILWTLSQVVFTLVGSKTITHQQSPS